MSRSTKASPGRNIPRSTRSTAPTTRRRARCGQTARRVVQTETWNSNGTVNDVHYYGITGQAYTDYDVVYGANNKPAEAIYSNGMTET